MDFRKITENKKLYIDLLLQADEQEDMIDKYLDRGDMFVLDDNGVKAECVVTKEGDGEYELKNIAVSPEAQKMGYGKALIDYVFSYYPDCRKMLVGTGDVPSTVGFYHKCGFIDSHRVKNFFTDNYNHIMIEDGIQLVDMVFLKREKIMLNEKLFSKSYTVKMLNENDVPAIYQLCKTNPLYYEHCHTFLTKQDIIGDLTALPPDTSVNQKYYAGFFEGENLIAVIDLIADYPQKGEAWIGFFMVHGNRSGRNIGSSVLDELIAYLVSEGVGKISLAYEKTNPQSAYFWKKNKFIPLRETEHKYGRMVICRRILAESAGGQAFIKED